MKVTVNGKDGEINEGATISELIAQNKIEHVRVAVELNGHVVPRDKFDKVSLREGDSLEIVTLVGGG